MAVVVHKFVRDKYSKRFPELESLVHTPLEYIKTVQVCSGFINDPLIGKGEEGRDTHTRTCVG